MSNRQRLKCRHPKKHRYRTRMIAYAVLGDLNRKGQTGLSVYHCPSGHWHIGRFKVGGN